MRTFGLFLLLFSALSARADTELVLQQGQCAQVDGKSYCWWFRPSNYAHPELPPRPCDFRKDCPITLLIPTTSKSPNLVSSGMEQKLNQVAPNPNILFFCRRQKDGYVLVRVEVQGEKKTEVTVNEYGDEDEKCKADESRYSSGAIQSVSVVDPSTDLPPASTGPVVVDTMAGKQPACPQTKQYKTEVKKVPVHKFLKKVF